MSYIGRFAPSPTGPLHAGSLVAALASWLDARAQGGRWLVRIEDVDRPRCRPGVDRVILQQLERCGLIADEPPQWQSAREPLYAAALDKLGAEGWTYPCGCTRQAIEAAARAAGQIHQRHGERIYPGTCRHGLQGKPPRAIRLLTEREGFSPSIAWTDRRLGPQQQDVAREVGDFVLRRADGCTAYQLAVVVDDADQRITHVVRGEDLADNTARQILLQRALGLPTPAYLHTPLVLAADGQKLSKQNGAAALDLGGEAALRGALNAAAAVLGIAVGPAGTATTADWLAEAVQRWPWR